MAPKKLGVGLIGLGIVGGAVERGFHERRARIDAAAGAEVRLIGACDKLEANWSSAHVPCTANAFDLLDDASIQVIVETIGGVAPARDFQLAALERGKHVVTANKELIAKHWNEMHEAARLAKRELHFEAAVASAAPVIAGVRMLGASRPRVLRGILNGTTNYICTKMDGGLDFDTALKEAQAAGYAEANPAADIDGFDAAYKLSILVSILEGRWFSPDQVRRQPLRGVDKDAFAGAARRGKRLRYLAVADFSDKATKGRVGPEEVPADSLEARCEGPMNVVSLKADMAGDLTFRGPGAGGDAAASAILGDVIAMARRHAV
ncbi:MAG: homoserine dehydrogenase [Chloroflexi bacterium]|nr:homoserine dehydrogenase [Chloroflexota bacterium]